MAKRAQIMPIVIQDTQRQGRQFAQRTPRGNRPPVTNLRSRLNLQIQLPAYRAYAKKRRTRLNVVKEVKKLTGDEVVG